MSRLGARGRRLRWGRRTRLEGRAQTLRGVSRVRPDWRPFRRACAIHRVRLDNAPAPEGWTTPGDRDGSVVLIALRYGDHDGKTAILLRDRAVPENRSIPRAPPRTTDSAKSCTGFCTENVDKSGLEPPSLDAQLRPASSMVPRTFARTQLSTYFGIGEEAPAPGSTRGVAAHRASLTSIVTSTPPTSNAASSKVGARIIGRTLFETPHGLVGAPNMLVSIFRRPSRSCVTATA